MSPGLTLDAGPMLLLDRNDRRVIALLERARERNDPITVPASALAQALRNPSRQARLSRLVRQPRTTVVALDRGHATRVGLLLAATATSDIADAHVVVCARAAEQPIATTDPDDLRALDPQARLIPL